MLTGVSVLVSCNSLEVTMPVGPQGEQGVPGKDGLSAYELWVKAVQDKTIDYTGPTDISHFFLYLKGKDGVDGKDGKDGVDGKSAYELWKEYVSKGVDDPHDPGTQWDKSRVSIADFYWFLTGNKGADGLIPYIKDGNWWIGDKDTGVKAQGETGASGRDGVDGQSAYEMWMTYVKETIEAGGKVTDQNGNEITLSDLTIQKFFQYLTGKAGPKGDRGDKGDAGADGKDGLTPEVDPITGEWIIINHETNDTIFTHVPAKGHDGKDGTDGKDGADGQDGSTPYVGDNGNWWINGEDTGVNAQGPKGDTGADGEDGTDGKDGDNGKSAYELWVEEVTSEKGLDNPHDPGSKWNPGKTTLEDFFEYLRGAAGSDGKDGADGSDGKDGADGSDGKSAYELWRELVLSESGLANPGNGVYDIAEYPRWPRTAVSVDDFYKYLRGSDGRDGNDGESVEKIASTDSMYVEEADWSKYNVVPVRALAKVREQFSSRDTTYEYANPYTGGCVLAVTGPGPVLLPGCTVTFKDQAGNTYTKTSDAVGYIYLLKEELPVWSVGSPHLSDLDSRTKPESFAFDGKTVTDPDKIAATCGVPYQVRVVTEMLDSWWKDYHVYVTCRVSRIVEGEKELSWGGLEFPNGNEDGLGYFYYRSVNDVLTFKNMSLDSYSRPDAYCIGDHFIKMFRGELDEYWSRSRGTVASKTTKNLEYGNGASPEMLDVHYLPVIDRDGMLVYYDHVPDYGQRSISEEGTIIPEYCSMGALDVSGGKGGVGDDPYTSFNGKLVVSDDGSDKVLVNNTNYELILGQTSFSFSLDYSTFGHVYMRKSYFDESTKTFRFKRYSTLLDYLKDMRVTSTRQEVTTFENSGMLGDVSINNKVDVRLTVRDGMISEDVDRSFTIRNVYDGFSIKFREFEFEDVFYEGLEGTFSYDEGDPYVASCTLGKDKYVFQAIKDAKSAPLP